MSRYVSQTTILPGLERWLAFAALCDTTDYENTFIVMQLPFFCNSIFVNF